MKTFAHARSLRKFRGDSSAFVAEPLEPRQMLTADLAVSFQEFSVPSPMVPGDRFNAGVIIDNNGPMAAVGLVSINFFLSTDISFDSNDVNIGSYPSLPISVSSGDFGDFSDQVRIPATMTPGNYFLLVRITPNQQIGDTNQSNNVAASDDFFPLEIKFGNLPGRGNAILEQVDPEGTIVQFQLFDGGMGTVSQGDDGRFDINVTGAGANSRLGIAASGGDGIVDIDDIVIAGSVSSITGTSVRLLGSLSVSGTLGTLTLGNVGGTAAEVSITIGQAGVATVIALGAVTNASISTPGAIESLSVASWTDSASSPTDLIEAQWLNSLISTGAFGASIDLSGRMGKFPTLGTAEIGGSLTGGSWNIVGRGGSIVARTSTVRWSASFTLQLSLLDIENTFRGTIAAKNFLAVNVGIDMLGAKILAGAKLGNDGRLGGTGDAADRFGFGRVDSLTVGRRMRNSIVGAGLDPVNGVFNDGNDRIKQVNKSRIGDVTIVGNMAPSARIVAGRFTGEATVQGVTIDTAVDQRFRLTDTFGPSSEFISADTTVTPSLIRVRFGDNQAVLRSSIGDGDIRIDAPGGAFSLLVELVSISRTTDGTPMVVTYRFTPPGGTWDPSENGTYSIVLLANEVFDVAGNPAGGGIAVVLGTFDVLV